MGKLEHGLGIEPKTDEYSRKLFDHKAKRIEVYVGIDEQKIRIFCCNILGNGQQGEVKLSDPRIGINDFTVSFTQSNGYSYGGNQKVYNMGDPGGIDRCLHECEQYLKTPQKSKQW